ncbi:protein NipSnap homolog 3A isoform X2 [Gouania willdenowi]|uniref:protein NipSnap homolog 3A isoform X2 n=1 Tax=Gouania willdenowi TaxID=441366 RepID=UPI00105672C4|nr:protein NipSnap homolog 3A-like isoform X2 [Gouania willdenowi]
MLKLSVLSRPILLLSQTSAAAQHRSLSSSSSAHTNSSPFYEFRTYNIKPEQNSAFLKLTNEKIHLRTAHSQLIGYWTVEYGGLNQVFHIWKYDSFSGRSSVRAALAVDPCWMSEYISKAIPMLTSQENAVTFLFPWSRLQAPPQEGGVFELTSYLMRGGGASVWGNALKAELTSHDALQQGRLLGAFHTEFGPMNTAHALWWFESADHRAKLQRRDGTDVLVHVDSQTTKLMFPCPFSPMK